jgi:integrase
MLAVLAGCGLRRAEAAALRIEDLQLREGHWVLADLNGKGGHIRTVPVPDWVKWAIPASISGTLFRSINKAGRVWGTGFTPKVIWSIVKQAASNSGLSRVAPHDLRRTCAKLCHEAGGELEQIQFLLGHVSVQTTERYLGCKQRREVSRLPVLWDHSLARYSVRTAYAKRRMRSAREWIAHSTSTTSATLWQFPITSPTRDGRAS